MLHENNRSWVSFVFLLLALLTALNVTATNNPSQYFIENKGQLPAHVDFSTRFDQAKCSYNSEGLHYQFSKLMPDDRIEQRELTMRFLQGNKEVQLIPSDKNKYFENYYLGDIASTASVACYNQLEYQGIYDGIDCQFYFTGNNLKYDFILAAGACVDDIQLYYEGAENVELDEQGNLIARTDFGKIKELKPYSYQEINGQRHTVESHYVLDADTLRFEVGSYDLSLPLVIDPVSLIRATYWNNSTSDVFSDVKVDANGNSYACGSSINAGYDAIIVKFDNAGQPLWTTYFGGSGSENPIVDIFYDYGQIVLDDNDNIYLTGKTNSTNLPIMGGFQTTYGGGDNDAFVAKFDATGQLLLSSYIGGTDTENEEGGGGIALDAAGNIFVGGSTRSAGFFNATGSYQAAYGGNGTGDGFLLKISPDFTTATGTYWGDTELQVVREIAIDSNDKLWATGSADSSGIVLPGYQATMRGERETFLLQFSNDLTQLEQGTFFGGKYDEEVYDMALDNNNNIVLTGVTFSTTDFPVLNPFQQFYMGGREAFVAKFNDADQLQWSTYLGGRLDEVGRGITTDNAGAIYVTGITGSDDFPYLETVQETYNTLNCERDAFIFKFTPNGTRDWASYYGGWRTEEPNAVAIHNDQQIFIVGKTKSTDLPTSMGAYQENPLFFGTWKAFLGEFEYACPSTPIVIHSTENATFYDDFWCGGPNDYYDAYNYYFTEDTCSLLFIAPPGYADYAWTRNGSTIGGNTATVAATNPSSSPDSYMVTVNNGNGCASSSVSIPDSTNWVRPRCFSTIDTEDLPHMAEIAQGYDTEVFCPGESINISLSSFGFCGSTFQWQQNFEDIPGETNQTYTITEPGCYRLAIINSFTGCKVYSWTKLVVVLDEVFINGTGPLNATTCAAPDSIFGCSSVYIEARFPTCIGCTRLPALTYSWTLDAAPYSSTSYGFWASQPGTYVVTATYGNCSYTSAPIEVVVGPLEAPQWVTPTASPICIDGLDSMEFAISHPLLGDSLLVSFYSPYMNAYDQASFMDTTLSPGCKYIRVEDRNGCTARTPDIELHDSLIAEIEYNELCAPTYLDANYRHYSCRVTTYTWYQDGVLLVTGQYNDDIYASSAGEYILQMETACGIFSDTVIVIEQPDPPTVDPAGPICLPVNLTASPPDANPNYIYHWYFDDDCTTTINSPVYLAGQNSNSIIANNPGCYHAIVEDTLSNCRSYWSNIVEVQVTLTGASIVPSEDIYSCQGSLNTNVVLNTFPTSPNFTYQWYLNNTPISGATLPTYTTSMEGSYTVYLENSCDNTTTPPVSIYNVQNPTVTLSPTGTYIYCLNDTLTVQATVNQPVTFQWFQDGAAMQGQIYDFLEVANSGSYTVQVTNPVTGCESTSDPLIYELDPLMSANITSTPECFGPCSGALAAVVSGGTSPFTYAWDDGTTTASGNSFCAGTHQLTVTDAIGCSATFSAEVLPGIALQIQATAVSCFGASDGSLTVTASQGVPPYTYNWNNAPNISNPTNLPAGTYLLTITDDIGCSTTASANIGELPLLSIDLSATDVGCNGDATGTLTTTVTGGSQPYTYTWNNPLADSSPSSLPAGTYSLTITDNSNCTATNSITINEPPLLAGNLTVTNDIFCHGDSDGSLSVIPSGGVSPYAYLWNTGETVATLSNLGAATYEVTLSDANNCSISLNVALVVPDSMVATTTFINNVSCNGGADGSATAVVSEGTAPYSFLWDNNENTATATSLNSGQHTVTVTDVNGCEDTAEVMISEPAILSSNLVGTDSVSCNGQADGSIFISTTGGTIPYVYNWSNGATNQDPTGLAAGNYTVTITDGNGCTNTLGATIFEPAVLDLWTTTIDAVTCFGGSDGSATLDFSGGTAPFTFLWDNGETTTTAIALTATIHSVTISDYNNCKAFANVPIPEPTLLISTINAVDSVNCFGESDGSILASAMGGTAPYAFLWSNGVATAANDNLSAGTYFLTVTDDNGCIATTSAAVAEPALLSLWELATIDVSCNGLSDGGALITASGGVLPYAFIWDNGETSTSPSLLDAGPHTVTITDFYNCQNTLTVNISEPAPLDAQVLMTDSITCAGFIDGEAQALPTGGTFPYTYLWDNGEVFQTASSLSPGIHAVVITDANGCFITRYVVIETPLPLAIATTTVDQVLCTGESNGSISLTPSGGTAPYVFAWNTGETTATITALAVGSYTATLTDYNNCTTFNTINITEPPLLAGETFLLASTLCYGSMDGQARVQPLGGTAPYTVLWDSGETGLVATLLAAGQHSVIVTDANACTWSGSIDVPSPDPMALVNPVAVTAVSCYGGNDGSATITVTAGTAPYYFSWNDGPLTTQNVVDDLATGIHSVLVVDVNGCDLGPISLTVGSPDPLQVALVGTAPLCWGEASGSVTALPSGGTPSYSYSWNNGANGQTAMNVIAGNYTVTVVDAQGCASIETLSLDQPTAIFNTFVTKDNICYGESKGEISSTVTFGGTGPYLHALNGGAFTPDSSFTGLAAGEYLLTTQDITGCQIEQTAFIFEPNELIVDAGEDLLLELGEDGQLEANANTVLPVTWSWEPATYLYCENEDSLACNDPLVLQPLETTAYIALIEDENGCLASDEVLVEVDANYQVFIPNVFTPNNDGFNDAFTVFAGPAVAQIRYLRVYDRWGELLFEGQNLPPNDLSVGWNGTMKGKDLNPGVFVYVAEMEFVDGRVVMFKGDVTILR